MTRKIDRLTYRFAIYTITIFSGTNIPKIQIKTDKCSALVIKLRLDTIADIVIFSIRPAIYISSGHFSHRFSHPDLEHNKINLRKGITIINCGLPDETLPVPLDHFCQ